MFWNVVCVRLFFSYEMLKQSKSQEEISGRLKAILTWTVFIIMSQYVVRIWIADIESESYNFEKFAVYMFVTMWRNLLQRYHPHHAITKMQIYLPGCFHYLQNGLQLSSK